MNSEVTLRIDLGLPAQNIMSHMVHYHDGIEAQVEQGINEALSELDIVALTKEGVAREIKSVIWSAANKWQQKEMIQKMISEKIGKILDQYTDRIVDTIAKEMGLDLK